ncbi:hypothetical protein [Oceanobacter mangrovi]|uniref:hypothetical protein n=1 Tax=Oceanobacter mangrovi TaxID=2862510 RepID=UPI001C8D601C|nr:hypothetical protein [Oceanobacter mangrovi]
MTEGMENGDFKANTTTHTYIKDDTHVVITKIPIHYLINTQENRKNFIKELETAIKRGERDNLSCLIASENWKYDFIWEMVIWSPFMSGKMEFLSNEENIIIWNQQTLAHIRYKNGNSLINFYVGILDFDNFAKNLFLKLEDEKNHK